MRSIPGILATAMVVVVDSGAVGAGVPPVGGAGDNIIVITIAVRVVMVGGGIGREVLLLPVRRVVREAVVE